jgi:hypothetical protein
VALALAGVMVTSDTIGSLPAGPLPPAFDARAAAGVAAELERDYPDRVPGSVGAARAAAWYAQTLGLYGLRVREDRWREQLDELGEVELVNLVTVVPGATKDVIVIVAHRDNDPVRDPAGDNASGVAAMVELLRGYAVIGTVGRRLEPNHTLAFVSTDGGAFGGAGAARFAARSPLARAAVATIVLDGLSGDLPVRLVTSAPATVAPAPALVRTAEARVDAETGEPVGGPGIISQLVGLGLPFGYGEQGHFLREGRSAVRLATAPSHPSTEGAARRLGAVGRGAEATLASLDAAIQLAGRTAPYLYVGDRVLRGWVVEAFLLILVLPVGLVVIDLLVRAVRRGDVLAPAWHALERSLLGAGAGGLVLWLAAVAGIFPRGGLNPPAPAGDAGQWLGLLAAVVAAVAVARFGRSARRSSSRPASSAAPFVVALAALLCIAVVVAAVNRFALVLVLPSLYAWIWLPHLAGRRQWLGDALWGIGVVGPIAAVIVIAEELRLGIDAVVYAVGLGTSGTVPWLLSVTALGWIAVAVQTGSAQAAQSSVR